MSTVQRDSYASLRELIRNAQAAPEGGFADATTNIGSPGLFRTGRPQSVDELLRQRAADPDEDADGPRANIFALPIARITSGWGAILGFIVGGVIGGMFGFATAFGGALIGIPIGSLLALAVVIGLAGSLRSLGTAWTLVLAGLTLSILLWVLW